MKLKQPKPRIGSKFFNGSQTSAICAMPHEHVGVACAIYRPWVPLGVDEGWSVTAAPLQRHFLVPTRRSEQRWPLQRVVWQSKKASFRCCFRVQKSPFRRHCKHLKDVVQASWHRRSRDAVQASFPGVPDVVQVPVRSAISMRCCAVSRRRSGTISHLSEAPFSSVVASLLGMPLSASLGIVVEDVIWHHFQSETQSTTPFWRRPQSAMSFGGVAPLPALFEDRSSAADDAAARETKSFGAAI